MRWADSRNEAVGMRLQEHSRAAEDRMWRTSLMGRVAGVRAD